MFESWKLKKNIYSRCNNYNSSWYISPNQVQYRRAIADRSVPIYAKFSIINIVSLLGDENWEDKKKGDGKDVIFAVMVTNTSHQQHTKVNLKSFNDNERSNNLPLPIKLQT